MPLEKKEKAGRLHQGGGRNQSATSQETPRVARSRQEPGGTHGGSSLQHCWLLDFRLLASRTVTEEISVALSPQVRGRSSWQPGNSPSHTAGQWHSQEAPGGRGSQAHPSSLATRGDRPSRLSHQGPAPGRPQWSSRAKAAHGMGGQPGADRGRGHKWPV